MKRASGGNFTNIKSGLGQGQDSLISSRNAQNITVEKTLNDMTGKINVPSRAMGIMDSDRTSSLIATYIAGDAATAKGIARAKWGNDSGLDTSSVEAVNKLI